MKKEEVEPGSTPAPDAFQIKIEAEGPYLIYGKPPVNQQFIIPNEEGSSWLFQVGTSYKTDPEPTAFCRCGASKKKPYCDGSHRVADWDPTLTASERPLLDEADTFHGPTLDLTDAEKYCSFARFCDAKGRVWDLIEASDEPIARELTIREVTHCPSARLMSWDKKSGQPHEFQVAPSIGLIEDPLIGCSGPIWVRGGIRIRRAVDDFQYEIRNRVTLCRCGKSGNKPYCDGTHASSKFQDELPHEHSGEKW